MAYIFKRHIFKDGKVMHKDRIAYANGEYVSLDDFEIEMQKKNDEIADLRKELREYKDYNKQIKHDVEKLENIRMRCRESARDSFDMGNYGALCVVGVDELKENDSTSELPFDAIEVANFLINEEYECEIPFTGRKTNRRKYDIEDLEQIAEHLIVYCNHNKENDEYV